MKNREIEEALQYLISIRKDFDKIKTIKNSEIFKRTFLEHIVFSGVNPQEGRNKTPCLSAVWNRRYFEFLSTIPAEVEAGEVIGTFSLVGKYKPINKKLLTHIIKGKTSPPFDYLLQSVYSLKKTPRGYLHALALDKAVYLMTSHCLERLQERCSKELSGSPVPKDTRAPEAKKRNVKLLAKLSPTFIPTGSISGEICQIPLMGVLVGEREVLDTRVGPFPKGMDIYLAKTFYSADMVKSPCRDELLRDRLFFNELWRSLDDKTSPQT